jgi:CDP-diacylglycerol--serine O-phosphatidyltransferase
MGERIAREFVLPLFVGAAAVVAMLVTYPYGTLTVLTLLYLAVIPFSYSRFQQKLRLQEPMEQAPAPGGAAAPPHGVSVGDMPAGDTKH